MAALNEQNTRHANLCYVYLSDGNGDQIIGQAQQVSVQEDGGTTPMYVIGTAYPYEHVHNQYTANISIGLLALYSDAVEQLQVGKSELIQLPLVDLKAIDQRTGEIMWVAKGVTLRGRSGNINANQPIQTQVQGLALRVVGANGEAGELGPDVPRPGQPVRF